MVSFLVLNIDGIHVVYPPRLRIGENEYNSDGLVCVLGRDAMQVDRRDAVGVICRDAMHRVSTSKGRSLFISFVH